MKPWNRSLVQRWHGCAGVAEGEASESGRGGLTGGGEPGVKGGIRVGPLDRPCKGAKAEGGSAGRGVPCEWGRVSGVTSRRGEVEEKRLCE